MGGTMGTHRHHHHNHHYSGRCCLGGACCWAEYRALRSCLFLFTFGGPILIIIGIVFLASSDTRTPLVNRWTGAVTSYNSGERDALAAISGKFAVSTTVASGSSSVSASQQANFTRTGGQGPLSFVTSSPTFAMSDSPQDSETWPDYSNEFAWQASRGANLMDVLPSAEFDSALQLSFKLTLGADSIDLGNTGLGIANMFRTRNIALPSCSSCRTTGTGGASGSNCNLRLCKQAGCSSAYVFNSASLTCTAYEYVSAVCLRVMPSNSAAAGWAVAKNFGSNDMAGCFYDGTTGTLSPLVWATMSNSNGYTNSQAATFEVRAANDPRAAAEFITGGSLSFGLTLGQKRKIGLGLLLGGIALTALMLAVCSWVFKGCPCRRNYGAMGGSGMAASAAAPPPTAVVMSPVVMGGTTSSSSASQPVMMQQPAYAGAPMQPQVVYQQAPMGQQQQFYAPPQHQQQGYPPQQQQAGGYPPMGYPPVQPAYAPMEGAHAGYPPMQMQMQQQQQQGYPPQQQLYYAAPPAGQMYATPPPTYQ